MHPRLHQLRRHVRKALHSAALCSQTSAGKARCRLPPLCEGKRLLVARLRAVHALKDAHNGACWLEWEEPLRRREPAALAAARQQYADDVAFWQAVQFMFYSQWQALKHYANRQEIRIIGDLPIYVALDSVDVWSCPQEFQLDENLLPTEVAAARRTASPPQASCGATRCSTGTPWPRPATHGGCGASNTCAASMMWFALTTSADLRAIMLSLRGSNRPERPLARRSRLCAVCCHKEKAG